jgi:hypothetical protein
VLAQVPETNAVATSAQRIMLVIRKPKKLCMQTENFCGQKFGYV